MSKTIVFVAITVIAIALFAAAPAANATLVSTSTCGLTNVPPNGNAACAGLGSVVGYTNLFLQVDYSLDVTFDPFNPPGSASFNLNAPLALWDQMGIVVNNVNRPLAGGSGAISIDSASYAANFQNPFNVAVSAVLGGSATNANAAMRWTLNGDLEQIPEPSTWVLLGSALVGLAVYRRRKAVN